MIGQNSIEPVINEEGWPCQRLRIGWSLILFYFFETQVGKQMPLIMPVLALGLGMALLVWAGVAIREWKLATQVALIQEAIDRRR